MAKQKEPQHPLPNVSSEESEKWVIGSLLKSPELIEKVNLSPEEFSNKQYRAIFSAILHLKQIGAEITEEAVKRSVGDIEPWLLPKVIAEVTSTRLLPHHVSVVRKSSQLRKLRTICQKGEKDAASGSLDPVEVRDALVAELSAITIKGKTSRYVIFPSPDKVPSDPPWYWLNIRTIDGQRKCRVRVSLDQLCARFSMKKVIIANMDVNPIFPKNYDDLVDDIVRNAKIRTEPGGASKDETVIYWLREWFKNAFEAEIIDDLNRAYVFRHGYYWIHADKMLKYIRDTIKVKIDKSLLWAILEANGAKPSTVISVSGSKIRLWGVPKKFFEQEIKEEALGEQKELKEDEEDFF